MSGFHGHLAQLLDAGVAPPRAVLLAADAAGGRWRGRAVAWSEALEGGRPFAEAMPGEPAHELALIHAGETGGRLPAVLRTIDAMRSAAARERGALIGRLIYPVLVLHLALVVMALPGVIAGDAAPWTLLGGPLILWALVAGAVLSGMFLLRAGTLARLALTPGPRWLARPWIELRALAVLHAALASGLLPDAALDLCAPACGNRIVAARLRAAAQGLRAGRVPDLAAALRLAGFDARLAARLAVGEASGTTETGLASLLAEARLRFESRLAWAGRAVSGTVYTVAALLTAWAVIGGYARILEQAAAGID